MNLPTVACAKCGRLIVWVRTEPRHDAPTGRPMPVDPEPNEAGNVFVRKEGTKLIAVVRSGDRPRPPGLAFMPHFATCPAQHRGRIQVDVGVTVAEAKPLPEPAPAKVLRPPAPGLFDTGDTGGSTEMNPTLIERLAQAIASGEPFSADDVTDFGQVAIDPNHTANAQQSGIGSLFRKHAAAGHMEATGEVIKSKSPRRHASVNRLWVGTEAGKLWAAQELGRDSGPDGLAEQAEDDWARGDITDRDFDGE